VDLAMVWGLGMKVRRNKRRIGQPLTPAQYPSSKFA
jgi:hypothetical protein